MSEKPPKEELLKLCDIAEQNLASVHWEKCGSEYIEACDSCRDELNLIHRVRAQLMAEASDVIGWISVDDALPIIRAKCYESEAVLVADADEGVTVAIGYCYGRTWGREFEYQWTPIDDRKGCESVTHWQPLPGPPATPPSGDEHSHGGQKAIHI